MQGIYIFVERIMDLVSMYFFFRSVVLDINYA